MRLPAARIVGNDGICSKDQLIFVQAEIKYLGGGGVLVAAWGLLEWTSAQKHPVTDDSSAS